MKKPKRKYVTINCTKKCLHLTVKDAANCYVRYVRWHGVPETQQLPYISIDGEGKKYTPSVVGWTEFESVLRLARIPVSLPFDVERECVV